jgi:hypothetical protein
MPKTPATDREVLAGLVERVTYQNTENAVLTCIKAAFRFTPH